MTKYQDLADGSESYKRLTDGFRQLVNSAIEDGEATEDIANALTTVLVAVSVSAIGRDETAAWLRRLADEVDPLGLGTPKGHA